MSNLAPHSPSVGFSIDPLNGFKWQGEYDISIDDLMNGVTPQESQFDKAKRLIIGALATFGAVLATDVMEVAEELGISVRTLKRAKKDLGVISVKRGEQWFWEMGEVIYTEFSGNQEGQGGQANALASLSYSKHSTNNRINEWRMI